MKIGGTKEQELKQQQLKQEIKNVGMIQKLTGFTVP